MSAQIFTKLHAALDIIRGPYRRVGNGDQDQVAELLEELARVPLIVLDYELSLSLDMAALSKSVSAIKAAGRLRLPYPRMAIEMWVNWRPKGDQSAVSAHRLFALVDELPVPGTYQMTVVEYQEGRDGERGIRCGLSRVCRFDFEWIDGLSAGVAVFPPPKEGTDLSSLSGWQVTMPDDLPVLSTTSDKLAHEMSIGLIMGIMLTNIAGLERELVEPKRSFNKARVARGKPEVPTHTVVRIGHVYNSSGQKVSMRNADGSRKPMAVHMRAAHTRRQNHGDKWLEENPDLAALPGNTRDQHIVLIDAVLVNYRDGTDLAKPLPKVVRF